jgi:hypothetical protein
MTDWKALCEELYYALQEVHDDIIDNGVSWVSLESQELLKRVHIALDQGDSVTQV